MRLRAPNEIEARDAHALLERGSAVALDVREPAEWAAGHIPGALLIPLGKLRERAHQLPTERRIVAVCRSGNRSGLATAALHRAGYQADNLRGGMQASQASGLPIVPRGGRVA